MKRIISAFWNSMSGLGHNFKNETAIRQEIIALALGVPLALFLSSDPSMIIAMIASLLLLLATELLNTGLERLSDRVTTEQDPIIKVVKDSGSAAVLMVTLIAVLVWGLAAYRFLIG